MNKGDHVTTGYSVHLVVDQWNRGGGWQVELACGHLFEQDDGDLRQTFDPLSCKNCLKRSGAIVEAVPRIGRHPSIEAEKIVVIPSQYLHIPRPRRTTTIYEDPVFQTPYVKVMNLAGSLLRWEDANGQPIPRDLWPRV